MTEQCATLNQTPEVSITCSESMEDGVWTVLPMPVSGITEKNALTWGCTAGYGLSANSENPDEAWKFIEWISSPEINLEYCKAFGCIPLFNSTLKDPYFQEGVLKGYADTMADPNVVYFDQIGTISQFGYFMSDFTTNEVQKYMTGSQSAEDTVANIAQWLADCYEEDLALAGQ